MTRLSIFTVLATLAVSALAHGPHYLPNHDDLMKRDEVVLRHRNGARLGGTHKFSRRNKKKSCSSNSSKSSSSSSSSNASSKNSASTKSSSSSDSSSSSSSSSDTSSSGSSSSDSSSKKNSSSSASTSSTVSASLSKLGVNQFTGTNGPTIGSWFHTDSSGDSTNGHSWCGFPYNDQTVGFAPDVSLMLANFGGDYEKAATSFCGLEAKVTTSDGVSKIMYIVDGFDSKWVKKAGAIDIVKGQYTALNNGVATDNKNDVLTVTWELTGNRNEQYKFKGAGL